LTCHPKSADIYPADFGWHVNWDTADERLEWYHNRSSIEQAGPCVRSNQLDFDEEVMYKSKQFLFDHVRNGTEDKRRPFALTVSLTHPHDPYTIHPQFWDMYEGVDIPLPSVRIPAEQQDPHARRLQKVCDLEGHTFSDAQIQRARRAYFGSVSYVDDCVGQLLDVLKQCRLDKNTIIIFSGDHGDMLGERDLWYKMNFFEMSARVPLLVTYPPKFQPHRISQNVSTLDLLPTLCDMVGAQLVEGLIMDGVSLMPHLLHNGGSGAKDAAPLSDTVFGEYMGEGTCAPLMMIRRGEWKFVTCPADPPQLFNLRADPLERVNLAAKSEKRDAQTQAMLDAFTAEAAAKWDFTRIGADVLATQRRRRFVHSALRTGLFTLWDYHVPERSEDKYIRSQVELDELERRARFPAVDTYGKELTAQAKTESTDKHPQAGAHGE